jgi:hypothetical protein
MTMLAPHESLTDAEKIACAESICTTIANAMQSNRGRMSTMSGVAWEDGVLLSVLRWMHGDNERCLCCIEETDWNCVLDNGLANKCMQATKLVKDNPDAKREDCKYWVSLAEFNAQSKGPFQPAPKGEDNRAIY